MTEAHDNGAARASDPQISDDELEALLAQWAEAEFTPPEGFHERTMERLRAAAAAESAAPRAASAITSNAASGAPSGATPKKRAAFRQTALRLLSAAAVLVLCLPLAHLAWQNAPFGDSAGNEPQAQLSMARSGDNMQNATPEDIAETTEQTAAQNAPAQQSVAAAQNAQARQSTPSAAEKASPTTVTSDGAEQAETDQALAQTPMAASLEAPDAEPVLFAPAPKANETSDTSNAAAGAANSDVSSVLDDEAIAALENDAEALKQKTDALKQDAATLRDEIAQLEALLDETPNDTSLQEKLDELTQKVEALERTLSRLEQRMAEQQTDATQEQQQ